jgi:hypothetical protein
MLLGSGVLDVGTARFLVQRRREQKRATDWLDLEQRIDQPESVIDVPPELVALAEEEASRSRRRLFRRRGRSGRFDDAALDLASWNLLEAVRATRVEAAERERYLHPDPAELSVRAANRAPILGRREPGHPLFGAVGVICADMPWMPRFDDPEAIPEALRPEVQALMSLPSIPISADLRIGPLGIAGPRSAALACARHILVSLYALSSADLHLHVITSDAQADAWDWSVDLAPFRQIEPVGPYSVLIVDGMDNFASSGISHQDAIDNRVGLVVIAEEVTGLPPYSGTVLQVDRSGGGRLTNDKGHIITGTPVGVTTDFARRVAADLYEATAER